MITDRMERTRSPRCHDDAWSGLRHVHLWRGATFAISAFSLVFCLLDQTRAPTTRNLTMIQEEPSVGRGPTHAPLPFLSTVPLWPVVHIHTDDTCPLHLAVPPSWGAYAHGLSSLRTDWGGYSHGKQAPVRGRANMMHAALHSVAGAPGVGAAAAEQRATADSAGPREAKNEPQHEFGSATGRALAVAGEGGSVIHMDDLADEQKAVIAARNLVHHPLHALARHTRSWHTSHSHIHRFHEDVQPSSSVSSHHDGLRNKGTWLSQSPWRRTHMAQAEARVETKQHDQEAGMSRLRRVIAQDRIDLQQARDELNKSAADLTSAKAEEVCVCVCTCV